MTVATARVATAHASRYLQQLCKHWSHKFETAFTPDSGRIDFGPAAVDLSAAADTLTLRLEAAEPAAVERLTGVVADHLKRFAFREALAIDWVRA